MTQNHNLVNVKCLITSFRGIFFHDLISLGVCLLVKNEFSVYFSDYSLFSVSFTGLLTAKNMAKEIDKKANDLQTNKTINT